MTTGERFVIPGSNLSVNQIDAAADVYSAISESPNVQQDKTLAALCETDIFSLARGICLPCAAATCINSLKGKRIIGASSEGKLSIGDLFRILLPYHNKRRLVSESGSIYQNPWFLISAEGYMYHQAIMAVAKGFDVESMSIANFGTTEKLKHFVSTGGKVAISLDNSFVIEQTLENNPDYVKRNNDGIFILVQGNTGQDLHPFNKGRHVSSILGVENDEFVVEDSFVLPQMGPVSMMRIPHLVLDKYLRYATGGTERTVVFASKPEQLADIAAYEVPTFMPGELVKQIKELCQG